MITRVPVTVIAATALLAFMSAPSASAQSEAPATSREGAVPIATLIAAAAKRSGKTFIVDPRVQGEALVVGADATKLDYPTMLAVLQVHGFVVVERGDVARVIPDANVRQQPVPIVTGRDSHPDAQFVAKTITVKNVPAAQLVPIMRPLLPQMAHLVAFPCTNMLMIVDTFGNVQRIEKLVQSLDVGGPYTPPKCEFEMKPSG